MKSFVIVFALVIFFTSCANQNKAADAADFKQISFGSTRCFGSCPEIYMSITNDGNIRLSRTIYTGKSAVDSSRSGNYAGKISRTQMDSLTVLIRGIDWPNLKVDTVTCCDRPVKTIIIQGNNGLTKMKSMTLPAETEKLVSFLTNLGRNIELPPSTTLFDFEEMKSN